MDMQIKGRGHGVLWTRPRIALIVAPSALLDTFAVMLVAGYSINMLAMFGMVLAIFLVPVFFVVVVGLQERAAQWRRERASGAQRGRP